jgi:hypothetical protein
MIQELEEAAENYAKGWGGITNSENSFIEGAKWQQERMYSEEDIREIILKSYLIGVDRSVYSKELEDTIIKQFKKK